MEMIRQITILVIIVVFIVVCAELGSLEASLSERQPGNKTEYEIKQRKAKELLPTHVIDVLTMLLLFGMGFALIQSFLQKKNKTLSQLWKTSFYFRYLIFFAGFSLLSLVLFYTTPLSSRLKDKIRLETSTWNIALGVFAGLAYIGVLLYILFMSLFKVHSINLFGYGAHNPSLWKGKDRKTSNMIRIGFFLIEALVMTFLTAIPLFLVAYYRNPEEKRKIFKNKDILTEFFLLCCKIFLFYVILQLTGGFDWTNKGYCMDRNFHNIVDPKFKKSKKSP